MSTLAETSSGPIVINGVPLREQLSKAEHKKKMTALFLVAPLLIFIVITFIVPIGNMLWRSVDNPRMVSLMPHSVEALNEWDGKELPPESYFKLLLKKLKRILKLMILGKLRPMLIIIWQVPAVFL